MTGAVHFDVLPSMKRAAFLLLIAIPICALIVLIGIIMELARLKKPGAVLRSIGYVFGIPSLVMFIILIVVCI